MFTLRVDDEIELALVSDYRADEFYQLIDANRDHVSLFLPWLTPEYTQDSMREWFKMARREFADGKGYGTQIYYRGQPAGSVGIHTRGVGDFQAEVGYWLGKTFTGKGIITRAVTALLDFAFSTADYSRVYIRCATENVKSCAVPERLGFTYEATMPQEVIALDGSRQDIKVYSILKDEWTVQQTNRNFEMHIDDTYAIRLFEMRHLDTVTEIAGQNSEHLTPWLPWAYDITRENEEAFIRGALNRYATQDGLEAGIWQGEKLIGAIGFHFYNPRSQGTEIGYWIDQNHTGKGIITRACRRMIDYAFEEVDLYRVEVRCAVDNAPSCNVIKRVGFAHNGVLRQSFKSGDKLMDMNLYSILKPEWEAKKHD